MGQLTPAFVFSAEKRMRIASAKEFQRLLGNLWYTRVCKEITTTGRSERLIWLLDSIKMQYGSTDGGEMEFEDLVSNTVEYTVKSAYAGFELNKYRLKDHNGGGLHLALEWARQAGVYAAYWPQKQTAKAMRVGATAGSLAYDGQKFFDTAHPIHPFDASVGTYDNIFKTSGGTGGPGACPIDTTNAATVDVAFNNLQKAFTYIRSIKMPTGEDPRMLKPTALIVPPALSMRAQQLTSAKFIAQSAATGGGAADVEAVISAWGIGQPIVADELGAAFSADGGSDTDYYIACQDIMSDEVGALNYVNADPFEIVYNDGMTDANLQRANKLQWTARGRNIVGYGHPYLLFRVKGT